MTGDQIAGPDWLKNNRPSFYIDPKAPPETAAPDPAPRDAERPVVDKTGVEQRFGFELYYSTDGDNEWPSPISALEPTMGLEQIVESAQRLPAEN